MSVPVGIGLIVLAGILLGWGAAEVLTGRFGGLAEVNVEMPADPGTGADSATASESRQSATESAGAAGRAEPGRSARSAEEAALFVNSYTAEAQYPFAQWTALAQPSGYLDVVALNGAPARERPLHLRGGDVVKLSGWAGDRELGVRFPYVLATVCGRVVAHAAVGQARPDVAEAVHPNLGNAGWKLSLAAAHLPDCAEAVIRLWAVAPGGRHAVFSLNGTLAIVPPTGEGTGAREARPASAPLLPEAVAQTPSVALQVTANVLNMRSCAARDCAVTGRLKQGRSIGLILDERDEWLLFALPDRAGWIARKYVTVGETD